MMKRVYAMLAAGALFFAAHSADAATTLCSTVTALGSATSHNFVTTLGNTCTFSIAQPAVGDLQNVGGGTVLGNATGSSAAPSATVAPVLGIAGTSTGTLGLSNSAGGAVTLQGGNGAVTSYTIDLPVAAPTLSGQALTATTAGVASWTTILSTNFTVTSETTAFNVLSSADWTRYDNKSASGSVTGTLPASPTAGDNWCFLVVAAQTLEALANTGETINLGGTVSASAGNVQSNTPGASICIYFETATAAFAWASTGPWQVN